MLLILAAALVTLETAETRIGFDPERHGAIVSLIDKTTGRDLAAPKSSVPLLYELNFEGLPPLTEASAKQVTVKREGDRVIIVAREHEAAPVAVECQFRTEPGSPLILGRISLKCSSDLTLTSVRFPALAWQKQFDARPEREFLVLPRNDGCLIQAPASLGWLPSGPYPGSVSMQFLAHYGDAVGVYAAAYDSRCFAKNFGIEKRGDAFRLALIHRPELLPRREWRMEYEVAIGTFHGDWQVAADLYKRWAIQQPWCRRTLAQRVAEGDVPR